ncbi:unnamed protein product [Vicia faba]|uniref:Uncharacterized protein n=1 Tax=Vicia faba TaxID=3906 RepID=A0AAV0YQ27_VICFA|nr:unnamed protein product [Vicia faba]
MNLLGQLQKSLVLFSDLGLTTGLPVWVPLAPVVASNFSSEPQMPDLDVDSAVVETTILITVPEVVQPTIVETGFSARGLSPSPYPTRGFRVIVCLLLFKEVFLSGTNFSECGEHEPLTPLFHLSVILSSWVPSTPEEFLVVVATEDMDFVYS